jgi:hypothetical protein
MLALELNITPSAPLIPRCFMVCGVLTVQIRLLLLGFLLEQKNLAPDFVIGFEAKNPIADEFELLLVCQHGTDSAMCTSQGKWARSALAAAQL